MLTTVVRVLGHRFSLRQCLSLWREAGSARPGQLDTLRQAHPAKLRGLHQADSAFGCFQFLKLGPHGLPKWIRLVFLRRRGRAFPDRFLSGRKLDLFLERRKALGVARLGRRLRRARPLPAEGKARRMAPRRGQRAVTRVRNPGRWR